ncbi:amidohydrolase family protein [uncultured Sphingomonas sp.]|uniref:N-acyl-D-amino-acid deacylase family protein n=1 Tax=uncultured Sphingomonas sp. TaxID=158754 RepID=UPI002632C166|nr:amidohydrolase family protein [uncultured Sphingomonas sp.]
MIGIGYGAVFLRRGTLMCAIAAVAIPTNAASGRAPAPSPVDILIAGGTVIDGTGAPARRADIGVRGDRIVFIGDGGALRRTARRVIDATGMLVTPGFIDPHTHEDADIASPDRTRRLALNQLAQGVTTIMVGNDGDGDPAISARFARMSEAGAGVNIARFVGFGAVRSQVVGRDDRAPTPAETERMRALVAGAMCEGAVGFSTGLYYAPQSFAKTGEVIALAREAAARGGVYDTHMRDEGSETIGVGAAVDEALRIGREAGMPVHIAHIKALGVDVQGKAGEIVAQVERARAAGQAVTADQYPWSASGTRLSAALVPRWAHDGGIAAMRKRLADPALTPRLKREMADNLRRRGGAGALLLTGGAHAGKRLDAIAADWRIDPVDAAIRILVSGDPAPVASFNMADRDIDVFARQPWVMTSSDGSAGHPRKYGSFALAWTRFVRDGHSLSPEQFVRRSSGLTAEAFGLTDRGLLKPGAFADVAVFDGRQFAARADYEHPERLAAGVRAVIVNGVVAIENGNPTGVLAGRAVRKDTTALKDCRR